MSVIDSLYYEKILLKEKLRKVYRKYYEQCYNQMKIEASDGKNSYLFQVPITDDDESKYDFVDCIVYIFYKFEKGGCKVNYIQPNNLFVSWKSSEKDMELEKKAKFLLKEDIKSRIQFLSKGKIEALEEPLRIEPQKQQQKKLIKEKPEIYYDDSSDDDTPLPLVNNTKIVRYNNKRNN